MDRDSRSTFSIGTMPPLPQNTQRVPAYLVQEQPARLKAAHALWGSRVLLLDHLGGLPGLEVAGEPADPVGRGGLHGDWLAGQMYKQPGVHDA